MIRLAVSVEGQTEEEFVKDVLRDHLRSLGVDVTPEALLFARPEALLSVSGANEGSVAELRDVRVRFPSPEAINDGKETAPSKRILKTLPRYRKVVDGPRIARRIGLDPIRAECARFDAWLADLEALGKPSLS